MSLSKKRPESMQQDLAGFFSTLLRGTPDVELSTVIETARAPLEDLCTQILHQVPTLRKIKSDMRAAFQNASFVQETLEGEQRSIALFSSTYEKVAQNLNFFTNNYLGLAAIFNMYVKGNLDKPPEVDTGNYQKTLEAKSRHETALKRARDILLTSYELHAKAKSVLPEFAHQLCAHFGKYDKYLHDRFIKSVEGDGKKIDIFSMLPFNIPDEMMKSSRGAYVKIALVDGNPLLTDVLLGVADIIPEYNERATPEKKGKKRPAPFLSQYAVRDASEKLAALSDTRLQGYLADPKSFFSLIGSSLGDLYGVLELFEPHQQLLVELPLARQLLTNEQLDAITENNGKRVARDIETVTHMDLDRIVQDKDEVLPSNRRETDYFKLREELFRYLRESMCELSQIEDTHDRREMAEEYVRKAADIKAEMLKVNRSEKSRKLRNDRLGDNEYYVGRQGDIGQFFFEREPVPKVTFDEVVGASFDRAKQHLNEIIETGEYSRIMSLSAPGGKVKSNILLIGPYGCGKTELARAVCGDKRVIGASVSVAGTLTAYMHESVNNVKRIYDEARDLRTEARDLKPVVLALDEFDGWFAQGDGSRITDVDMAQIGNVFLEVLDGMEDYNGIITMAMTNNPKAVPPGILRRFRYVDIVGQLTEPERVQLLQQFLERRLPLAPDVPRHYSSWAKKLEDAPGDVVRKVLDEVHFAIVPPFLKANKPLAQRTERVLLAREARDGSLGDRDIAYVRGRLQKYGVQVTPAHVESALTDVLQKPQIRLQIDKARKVYDDVAAILNDIAEHRGFGMQRRSNLFDID